MKTTTQKAINVTPNMVLVFKTRGNVNNMARLHDTGCSMVKATRTQVVVRESVAEEVADLIEREYLVVACKCCK